MIHSREATLWALGVCLLIAGCESRLPTESGQLTPPQSPAANVSPSFSSWSAAFTVPQPLVWPSPDVHKTGIIIPGGNRWYRVRIEGALTLLSNRPNPCVPPEEADPSDYSWLDSCHVPLAGLVLRPDGLSLGPFTVVSGSGRIAVPGVRWRRPDEASIGIGDWRISTNPVREGLVWVSTPRELIVSRGRVGGYRFSGIQTVLVDAYDPVTVVADRVHLMSGDTVTFTIQTDRRASRHRWIYWPDEVTDSTPSAPRAIHVIECADQGQCRYAPEVSGQMGGSAFLSDFSWHRFAAKSPPIEVGNRGVRIVEVDLPLPDSSFTTRERENTVRLRAEVGDTALASRVEWEALGTPEDGVTSGDLLPPAKGTSTTLVLAAAELEESQHNSRIRWEGVRHPGNLHEKRLAYRVRAYYAEGSDTVWSDPIAIRQHESDVVRQEYIDFAKESVPERMKLGVYHTPNFSSNELNSGDYAVFLSTDAQRNGLENVRALAEAILTDEGFPFDGLVVTSGYRNPVHHHVHSKATSTESQHLYGNAADVRIWGLGLSREKIFEEFRIIAKDALVAACYEPESVVRGANTDGALTHFHFDWRSSCPVGW